MTPALPGGGIDAGAGPSTARILGQPDRVMHAGAGPRPGDAEQWDGIFVVAHVPSCKSCHLCQCLGIVHIGTEPWIALDSDHACMGGQGHVLKKYGGVSGGLVKETHR